MLSFGFTKKKCSTSPASVVDHPSTSTNITHITADSSAQEPLQTVSAIVIPSSPSTPTNATINAASAISSSSGNIGSVMTVITSPAPAAPDSSTPTTLHPITSYVTLCGAKANQPKDGSIQTQMHTVHGKPKEIKFQSHWFDKFPWLHYDMSRKAVFCFTCLTAKEKHATDIAKCVETAFTEDGFRNWRKALEKFAVHHKSESHRLAEFHLAHMSKQSNISCQLNKQIKDDQQLARKCMNVIFNAIRYLARQGLALRGHETDGGNLMQLLKFKSKDSPDLKTWLMRKYDMTSPERQNEILVMFSHTILRGICENIRSESQTFAVITDGTQDLSGLQQESICLRYVDKDLEPRECFMGFYETSSTTGENLAHLLKDALIRFNLDIKNLRFQTYDGAANMAGAYKGCQAAIKRDQPLALYVHCGAHVTNLVASHATSSIPFIRDGIQVVQDLGNMYKMSGKFRHIFSLSGNCIEEEENAEEQCHSLKTSVVPVFSQSSLYAQHDG